MNFDFQEWQMNDRWEDTKFVIGLLAIGGLISLSIVGCGIYLLLKPAP